MYITLCVCALQQLLLLYNTHYRWSLRSITRLIYLAMVGELLPQAFHLNIMSTHEYSSSMYSSCRKLVKSNYNYSVIMFIIMLIFVLLEFTDPRLFHSQSAYLYKYKIKIRFVINKRIITNKEKKLRNETNAYSSLLPWLISINIRLQRNVVVWKNNSSVISIERHLNIISVNLYNVNKSLI